MNLTDRNIEFKGLGIITLYKSPRARKISISIRPFEGIRVTIPVFVSYKSAEKFIRKKESWLVRNMAKINNAEKSMTIFDFETSFRTNNHALRIVKTGEQKLRAKLSGGEILVFCPIYKDIRDKDVQQLIRRGIEAAWRKEAAEYLPARLEELAIKYRFDFSKVSIRNNRTRWGSCSAKNNINLSIHLMRLPRYLSDYVILHELVHTMHKNHGWKFWNHLDSITGNAKALNKELKKYRIDIY